MMLSENITSVIAAVLACVGAVMAAWLTSRAETKKGVPSQYQALVEDIQEFADRKEQEYEKRVERQDSKICELSERVMGLEMIAAKYDSAVRYLRGLRSSELGDQLPPLPHGVGEDVEGGVV